MPLVQLRVNITWDHVLLDSEKALWSPGESEQQMDLDWLK